MIGLEFRIDCSVIRYRGYLRAEHDVRITDVQRLNEGRELCDRMVDFLLA